MNIPTTYDGFRQYWAANQQAAIIDFTSNNYSFIPNLLPEQAIQMPTAQLIYLLEKRFGQANVFNAIIPQNTIPSPIVTHDNSQWLKTVNMVGINVRTIGSFWNVVKYCLTIPKAQSSVHLLPIWECGVVASLYGMASWNINPEFFDDELANHFPQLDSVEKQLKVVCNLLHLMGKTVGMDIHILTAILKLYWLIRTILSGYNGRNLKLLTMLAIYTKKFSMQLLIFYIIMVQPSQNIIQEK
jgi:tetrahydromethanopterin S-methyltransferase subunit G